MPTINCLVCKKEKGVSDFYFRNDLNKYRRKCKNCIADSRKYYYLQNAARIKNRAKRYYFDNWEVANERRNKWMKSNWEKVKGYLRKCSRRYYNNPKNKKKIRARGAINNATKKGKIKKLPCKICKKQKTEAHHHKGYEKRNYLKVEWLCSKHHKDKHKK